MTITQLQHLLNHQGISISVQALSAIELEISRPKLSTAQAIASIIKGVDLQRWNGKQMRRCRKSME